MSRRPSRERTGRGEKDDSARGWTTTLDWLLVVALILVVGTAATRALRASNEQADTRAAIAEAKKLNEAVRAYYASHGAYPNSFAGPRLDLTSLDPLRKRGYYTGHVTATLLQGRLDGYDAPDDRGPNQEFWLEMTLERNHSVRLVVACSDDAPMGGGRWLDGVYLYRKGELKQV